MTKKILLVDDEKVILNCCRIDFENEGYNVTTAESGEEAIAILDGDHFDLLITDLSMPGVDGIGVLQVAKKKNSNICAIILTGYGDITSAIDALRLGADDYILKPCDSEELILRVERCLEKQNLALNLVESELQKALLLDSAGEGICGIDTQGRITFINPAAEKMLGYTNAEIFGNNNHSLIHHTKSDGSPYPMEECRMQVAVKENCKIHVTDELLWRKDGTSFPVEYSSTPIRHNNEVSGAVVIFSDLTERKKQEELQRETESHLQQMQKNESLNSMAAGIAHNFNNILMAVLGNQELALESMPAEQKERHYIEAAFEASKRAAKLSTMMLQFLGQSKMEMQKFELTELLEEMVEILRPQVKSQIELSCESGKVVFLKGDIGMIRQVIVNLVINAAESIDADKGQIRLQHGQRFFSKKELKQPHQHVELPEGEYVYLNVLDSGSGMEKDVLARAFEPFYTTKFTGRGMGLATILGIMRNHKGAVSLKSQIGKGTTATVIFPAPTSMIHPAEQPPKAAAEGEFSGTVLLVDDEQMLLDLGQALLHEIGFEVLQATNGLEALELFEQNMGEIDLILLDIAMPRLNGIETLNKIREKSTVPVIMVTGYSVDQISDQFMNIPNVTLLQKPYPFNELKSKIRKLIHPV